MALSAPRASSPRVRRTMQGNRGSDTRPELVLRRELHRQGLRYRVGIRPIAEIGRRADIVFPRARLAIFVDGCFWHACPRHFVLPRTNTAYWSSKILGNAQRDNDTNAALATRGWMVIRVWEHTNCESAVDVIKVALAEGERYGIHHAP